MPRADHLELPAWRIRARPRSASSAPARWVPRWAGRWPARGGGWSRRWTAAATAPVAWPRGSSCLPTSRRLVAEADVVLSIVPPGEAGAVAGAAAAAAAETGGRPLVADLNAVSPATVRRLDGTLAAAGLELVDGSISGPPPRPGGATRLYLSGPRADVVAALGFVGAEPIVLGPAVGTASALKMCTASVYKGTALLLAHALGTAQAEGVLDPALADLRASFPELLDGAEQTIAMAAASRPATWERCTRSPTPRRARASHSRCSSPPQWRMRSSPRAARRLHARAGGRRRRPRGGAARAARHPRPPLTVSPARTRPSR